MSTETALLTSVEIALDDAEIARSHSGYGAVHFAFIHAQDEATKVRSLQS